MVGCTHCPPKMTQLISMYYRILACQIGRERRQLYQCQLHSVCQCQKEHHTEPHLQIWSRSQAWRKGPLERSICPHHEPIERGSDQQPSIHLYPRSFTHHIQRLLANDLERKLVCHCHVDARDWNEQGTCVPVLLMLSYLLTRPPL